MAKMVKVTIVTHNEFLDPRTSIQFHERLSQHPDPEVTSKVYLGVADEVPEDVAREHYLHHPSFLVEGLEKLDEPADQEVVEEAQVEEAQGVVEQEQEQEDGEPLDAVDFASEPARMLAGEAGLTPASFKGEVGGGVSGFTTKDVRDLAKRLAKP